MSGAGLQGFTSGLERGVGLANTLIDSKRRRQFEDERMDMARQQFGMSQEQHDWSRDQQGRIAEQHEWQGQQQARAADQHEQNKKQHNANMRIKRLQTEKAELERDMPIIQLGLQKAASGQFDMLTDEERAAFSRHKRFDPGWLASDKVGQALNVVEDTLRRATAGEPIDYNDPALIEAENVLFEFDLNKGGGGSKKRILRQGPGKQDGTLIFELDADGKRVPMTEGRATAEEGDNNVLQQPLEAMIQRVAGIRTMHNALRQSGAQSMMQMAGMVEEQETPGPVSMDNASLNTAERIVRNFWGSMNENGQWVMEPGSRENYVESLRRTEQLVKLGIPVAEAARIATMSIAGIVDDKDARQQAEKEAKEQHPGWRAGSQRDSYIEQRVPEIIAESRQALQQYQQLTGSSKPGLNITPQQAQGSEPITALQQSQKPQQAAQPQGSGTKEQPFKAQTQDHVDWFKNSAPQGAIIEVNGKLFTK